MADGGMTAHRHNLNAAMRLAAAGLFVFPVRFDKRPVPGFKWQDWATNDPREVEEIWRYYRADFMPALHLGRSGLVAVDVDRHGAVDGVAAFDELLNHYGELPRCPAVETPGAGYHLVFRQPPDRSPLGNRTGDLPDGIDVRGDGGYIVACGAVRDDGCYYGGVPGWPDLAECFKADAIPPIMEWFVERVDSDKSRPVDDGHHSELTRCPQQLTPVSSKRGRAWALSALDRIAGQLARLTSGRNNALNSGAMTMAGYAWLGINENEVREALWQACLRNNYIAEHGVRAWDATFRSGWTDGLPRPLRGPRDIEPGPLIVLKPKSA
jgi:hypothetical protein